MGSSIDVDSSAATSTHTTITSSPARTLGESSSATSTTDAIRSTSPTGGLLPSTKGSKLPTTLITASSTSAVSLLTTASSSAPSTSTKSTGVAAPTSAPAKPSINNTSNSSILPSTCRNAIIITTVVGGSLILVFLLYALYRRRKGATYAEIVHFRRHSANTIATPMTASRRPFSVYLESRFSIRSSRHGSLAGLSRFYDRKSPKPPPLANQFPNDRKEPAIRQERLEKFDNQTLRPESTRQRSTPHLPSMAQLPRRPAAALVASRSEPHVGARKGANGSPSWLDLYASKAGSQSFSGTPEANDLSDPLIWPPISPANLCDRDSARWSWTNSQAPPTPRLHVTSGPSLGPSSSLPQVQRVRSWVHGQSERRAATAATTHEEESPLDRNRSVAQTVPYPTPPKHSVQTSGSKRKKLSKRSDPTKMGKPPIGRKKPGRTSSREEMMTLPPLAPPAIRVQAPSILRWERK